MFKRYIAPCRADGWRFMTLTIVTLWGSPLQFNVDMEKERSQMQLDDSYQLLAQMTDYKDSPSCKEKQQCSLTEAKDAFREGANKQVMSSQADSLIKISRIWADFCPANTSNQPI